MPFSMSGIQDLRFSIHQGIVEVVAIIMHPYKKNVNHYGFVPRPYYGDNMNFFKPLVT